MKPLIITVSMLLWLVSQSESHAEEPTGSVMVESKNDNASKNWTKQRTTLLAHLTEFKPVPHALSKYGGRTDRKDKATGFFHTKQTDGGWVLVDPQGYHYISVGICSISPNHDVADHKEHFPKKFADTNDWTAKTHAQLMGGLKFNSLGCWSDWEAFQKAGTEVPYVRMWNLMASYGRKKGVAYKKYGHAGFRKDVLPVFDEEFSKHCDEVCKKLAETKDDPWLIGHFSDNELPFKSDDILARYLSVAPEDESYKTAARFLKDEGIDQDSIKKKHDVKFTELVLKTYYKTVHDAIRKHDPNHLILGSRLHGSASQQDICYTASGPFVDVVSINYYHRWTPVQDDLNKWAELSKRPILITEWYAKGADSGLNNAKGAGFTVPTQADRGRFYENFTIGLLKNRNVVGWHWFRYIDDGDLKTDGNSSNKGILNLKYEEYRELGNSMRSINSVVYPLSDFLKGNVAVPKTDE